MKRLCVISTMIAMVDSEYLDDKKVQKIDADIRNFKTDLQKTEMELEGLDSRLDAEIESTRQIASSRRDSYEAVRGRLREAEREWKDADKVYRDAKKQKDKTRSTLKKKVDNLRKRIRDAERTKERRFRNLDKDKRKLVEKAKEEKAHELEKEKARELDRVEEEKKRELGL